MSGWTQKAAMKEAGYAEASNSDFFRSPLGRRYLELRLRRFDVTPKKVTTELAKLAFANIASFMVEQEDGSVVFDLSGATPEETAAIQEYVVESYTEGRGDAAQDVKKVRLKLADKRQALDSLARTMGMFNDKLEIKGQLSLAEQLQQGRNRLAKPQDNKHDSTT